MCVWPIRHTNICSGSRVIRQDTHTQTHTPLQLCWGIYTVSLAGCTRTHREVDPHMGHRLVIVAFYSKIKRIWLTLVFLVFSKQHGYRRHQELPHPGPSVGLLPSDVPALTVQRRDAGGQARGEGRRGGGRRRGRSSGGGGGMSGGDFPKLTLLHFGFDQAAAGICRSYQSWCSEVFRPHLWRPRCLWHLQWLQVRHDQRTPALLRWLAEDRQSRSPRGAGRELRQTRWWTRSLCRRGRQQPGAFGWTVRPQGPTSGPRSPHDQATPSPQLLDGTQRRPLRGQCQRRAGGLALRRHAHRHTPSALQHAVAPQHSPPRRHSAGLQWPAGKLGSKPGAHTRVQH